MTSGVVLNKRTLLAIAISAAVLLVAGFVYISSVQNVTAVAPADFGLTEGDTVSASGSDDPDVYIVNEQGFKRLFLNPVIFGFYGHLGGFGSVKSVSPATRDAFPTSGLFRLDGDEKVYGVETTGEDTAMLHWVNTTGSQAVADDPDFFKKVFVINQNEFNWYSKGTDYTSVSQVPDYVREGAVLSGPVTVSLAPGNPTAKTLTDNAKNVEMLRVRVSGTGTISQLTLTRGQAGQVSDIANVYIYEGSKKLTSGRSVSSSTGQATFLLNKAINGTVDLSVIVDFSGASGGNVHNFSIASAGDVALTSGTVGGSYPLSGANFAISGASSGTLTVTKTGSISNPSVGQQNVQLTQFDLQGATEAIVIKRLNLLQGGNVSIAGFTNLTVEVDSVQIGTGYTTSNDYVVFDLNYTLIKGDTKTFKVWGDVVGKKNETIRFYFEDTIDIFGVGDQFGFGAAVTFSSDDMNKNDSTEAHELTLQGGNITLAFNGPNATNISTNTQDMEVLSFSVTPVRDIEIRRTEIVICWDENGDGGGTTYNTLNTTDGQGITDIGDVKLVNKTTGFILAGPYDGDSVTAADTSCPGGVNSPMKRLTDVFTLPGGVTTILAIRADINTALNLGAGQDLANTDIVKFILNGWGDLVGTSGTTTIVKYAGTNEGPVLADFAPSGDMSGNELTINDASLVVGLAGSPGAKTYVKGTLDQDLAGYTFAAGLGSSIVVTDVTVSGYVRDASSGQAINLGIGGGADTALTVGGLVAAVKLYDGDTGALLSATPQSNNLSTSTGTVVFRNMSWSIPAGATKRLLVKGDLSTNPTSGSSDLVRFDIASTTGHVVAQDGQGKTVAFSGSATGPIVTVNNAGTITQAAGPNAPTTAAMYWGQPGVAVSEFRFTSTNEAFYIEKLNLEAPAASSENTNAVNNVARIMLEYKNEAGNTVTANGSLNSVGSVSFGFTGTDRPYVPKDSNLDVKVKIDLSTKSEGATQNLAFSIDLDGDAAGFRAVGAGSGTVDTQASDVTGNDMRAYRVWPRFAYVSAYSGQPVGTQDLLKFTVKAEGTSDGELIFDSVASLSFTITASGTSGGGNSTFLLYEVDSGGSRTQIASPTAVDVTAYTTGTDIVFDFDDATSTITGGATKTYVITGLLAGFTKTGQTFQIQLKNAAAKAAWKTDGVFIENPATVLKALPMLGGSLVRQL